MARAAVPRYLGTKFSDASPAMRFGMYMRVWGDDWKSAKASEDIWRGVKTLSNGDRERMVALAERQQRLAEHSGPGDELLVIVAESVAPFVTGLGIEHPLENGFSFLEPYGLPYLAGSGVKGVVRQAAMELASGAWGETHGWTDEQVAQLFGPEPEPEQPRRGALSFWDVIPKLKADQTELAIEVMTPHQTHYHQQGGTPHDSGQPNPIAFLAVPAGAEFAFHVRRTHRGAFEGDWRELLESAFEHAFEWLGFGAKTSVGYGAMKRDRRATAERRARALKAAAETAPGTGGAGGSGWQAALQSGDNSRVLEAIEERFGSGEALSAEELEQIEQALETHWNGVTRDPDATRGRKNKPKFKPRPRALAKRLIELREGR